MADETASYATSDEAYSDDDDPHRKHPPLPGHQQHRCTDVPCLILFLIGLAAYGYINWYAYEHGRIYRIFRGYNYKGEMCGVNPAVADRMLVYWCPATGGYGVDVSHSVCVSECPTSAAETPSQCALAGATARLLSGNATNGTTASSPAATTNASSPAATTNASVQETANPAPSPAAPAAPAANITEELKTLSSQATVQVGRYCLPMENVDALTAILGDADGRDTSVIRSLQSKVIRIAHDVRAGYLALVAAAVIAIFLGYCYLCFLDRCAQCLVYACEFVIVGGTMALGAHFLYLYYKGGPGDDELVHLGEGCGLVLLGFLMLCAVCCLNQGLSMACGITEAACQCMWEEPTLLLDPIVNIFWKALCLAVSACFFVLLVGSGQVEHPPGRSAFARDFTFSPEQEVFMGVHIFMFLWIVSFFHALSQYAMVWTTQAWYFTPYRNGEKVDKPLCGIVKGYCNGLAYHSGTLAFGGLMIAICKALKLVVGVIATAAQDTGNPIGACLAKCCFCCVTCFQSCLEFLSKNAYMDVAITSDSFCPAAKRALELLSTEIPAVAALNGTQAIFYLTGTGFVAVTSGFITLELVTCVPYWAAVSSPSHVHNPRSIAIIGTVIAGAMGACFMSIFDNVADAILYCFASEQRRHAQVDHDRYGDTGEHEETGFLGWLMGSSAPEAAQNPKRVEYAPDGLRRLIEANQ